MNIQILKGTLLGDAWIQKFKDRPNSFCLSFSQQNKSFAIWKADLIGLPYYIHERNRFDKRTNKYYYCCQIIIKASKDIKQELYNLFYTPTKKVTLDILNSLNNQAIAIWYLDDGNMYYNGNNCHIKLAVNGFSFEERDVILKWFNNKYSLNFKHNQKAIRLTSKEDCIKFMNIVEEYIPDCMKYKKLSESINNYKINKYGK